MKASNVVSSAVFACAVAFALLCPTACAADSSGAHVFARYDNGTNIVSRLVPDGTDVATMGAVDEHMALQPAMYSDRPTFTEWEYSGLDGRFTVLSGPRYIPDPNPRYSGWYWDEVVEVASGDSYEAYALSDDANATNLVAVFDDEQGTTFTFTATRLRTDVTGYALGPQTNKVLASTLAVDRLWDRSTNSFLKAEWENGDSTRSRIVESDAGIDFYMYDGDWYRESRWGFNGLKIWGDDYVEVTGGDAPGLWVGASAVGDNNILNIPSIGYCNGHVALRGPASDYYYDEIYFPTRVGGGRDNVFALTKDIDRATNALYGAVSGALDDRIDPSNAAFSNAVLAVGFNVDTNTVAAINALLAESGEDGLPVGGVATTGAILAALAAAIAALKRKSGTATSPLRMLGEDGAWYLVGVDSSGEFYVRKEGSEPAFQPADPDDPELTGTVSTEGEVNPDGTFTVEGEVNDDGTLSVEV